MTVNTSVEASAAETRSQLTPITWTTFEKLLQDLGDNRAIRLTFDQSTLEIMTPLGFHESRNRLIDDFVRIIADEWDLPLKKMGSLTLRKAGLQKGVEPDSCYYVQNEPLVRGKVNISLEQDPPPDLVLEVDMSSHSLNKFPIYAALGVTEVWRYDGGQLLAYVLDDQGENYQLTPVSRAFSPLIVADLLPFIDQSLTAGETATLRAFRHWLRNLKH